MRGKIFWHESFYEALQYELYQYRAHLQFQSEYLLSKEALRMDALVIKKDKGVHIEKNIGRIFREHNIFEFKSELDSFSRRDYIKVFGYACLYSSLEQVPDSEITISIVLTMFPRELVKYLENKRRMTVRDLGNGIYHVDGDVFPVQILVSKKLSPVDNVFLRNLRSNLSAEDISSVLELGKEYGIFSDKNVYLDRLAKANLDTFREAMDMTDETMLLLLEGAEERGWFAKRDKQIITQSKKETAKKFLLLGVSVEKIAEATELPIETVMGLQ